MSIFRRQHTANFTTISNKLFDDLRLKADEVGVLAFLISRPHNWELRRSALQRRWDIGPVTMKRIINNWMRTGWCKATKKRLPNGTFCILYDIFDLPGEEQTDEQIREALSLVSSEASPDDVELLDDGGGGHPPVPEPPPPSQPVVAGHPLADDGVAYIDSTNTDSAITEIAVAADARDPLISKSAMDLAEQLLVIAGHDPKFWPPGWCGAPMRVQTWLTSGWNPEIIIAATRGAMARKTGPPPNSVAYFEKAIAEEVVRQSRPLPETNDVSQVPRADHATRPRGNAFARLAARLDRSSG